MDCLKLAAELLNSVGSFLSSKAVSGLYNMSQGESFILNYLLQHPDSVTPGIISDAMNTSTARTAAALRTLEAKGCILRTIDKTDRRRVFVELTTVGISKVEEMRKTVQEFAVDIIEALGDDAEEFIRLIDKIALNQNSKGAEFEKTNKE